MSIEQPHEPTDPLPRRGPSVDLDPSGMVTGKPGPSAPTVPQLLNEAGDDLTPLLEQVRLTA